MTCGLAMQPPSPARQRRACLQHLWLFVDFESASNQCISHPSLWRLGALCQQSCWHMQLHAVFRPEALGWWSTFECGLAGVFGTPARWIWSAGGVREGFVITLQPLCLLYSQHALALSVCAGVNVLDGATHAPFPARVDPLHISPYSHHAGHCGQGVWGCDTYVTV
jgi:hypothetical protein